MGNRIDGFDRPHDKPWRRRNSTFHRLHHVLAFDSGVGAHPRDQHVFRMDARDELNENVSEPSNPDVASDAIGAVPHELWSPGDRT